MRSGKSRSGRQCARKAVEFGHAHGLTLTQTAKVLHDLCGVSRLAAHRLVRDWTLGELVTQLTAAAEAAGLPAVRITGQRICHWEAGERPSTDYLDLLCRVYQTRPDQLGFGKDYTPAAEVGPPVRLTVPFDLVDYIDQRFEGSGGPLLGWRRDLLTAGLETDGVLSGTGLVALEELRRYSRGLLDQVPASAAVLDRLEEAAAGHAAGFWLTGPARTVCEIAGDYFQVEALSVARLPAALQSRAWLLKARLSGLIGWGLVEAGIPSLARDWFALAVSAVAEHWDRQTRTWAMAVSAFAALAVRDWATVDKITSAALVIAEDPSPATVMAHHVQAEAYARLGRSAEALRALQAAELDAAHMDGGDAWYRTLYPWELYWAQRGHVLLSLGMTGPAQQALSTGIAVARPEMHRLRAHLALDLIACQTSDSADRSEQATAAVKAVPEDQWSARLRDHLGVLRALIPLPRTGRDGDDRHDADDQNDVDQVDQVDRGEGGEGGEGEEQEQGSSGADGTGDGEGGVNVPGCC